MNKKCTSFKPAQYICINKNCNDRNPFLCADPQDLCKNDHQSCAMISWIFLQKKVLQAVSPQMETLRAQTIKPFYQILKKTTKTMEILLYEDKNNTQMKQILKGHLGPTEKGKISEFIGEKSSKNMLDSPHFYEQIQELKYYIEKFEANVRGSKIKKQTNLAQRNSRSQLPIKQESGVKRYNQVYAKNYMKEDDLVQSHIQSLPPISSKVKFQQPFAVSSIKKQPNSKEKSFIQHGSNLYVKNGPSPVKSKIKNPVDKKGKKFQENALSPVIQNHNPKGPLFSKITNNIEGVYSLFPQKFVKSILLYRASENEFLVSKFHEKCDHITHTLTILITQDNKIIGGYTPLPWVSGGGEWYPDNKQQSFLFNLSKGQKYPLQVKQKAIWCSKAYGPSFGYPDLQIADRAIINSKSCSNFPNCYNNGNYNKCSESAKQFCGSSTGTFRIRQWEVYKLEFPSGED